MLENARQADKEGLRITQTARRQAVTIKRWMVDTKVMMNKRWESSVRYGSLQ